MAGNETGSPRLPAGRRGKPGGRRVGRFLEMIVADHSPRERTDTGLCPSLQKRTRRRSWMRAASRSDASDRHARRGREGRERLADVHDELIGNMVAVRIREVHKDRVCALVLEGMEA